MMLNNPSRHISSRQLIDAITKLLDENERVVFGYLYGSIISEGSGNDIDIAVFQEHQTDNTSLSVDIKIDLYRETGISADAFDVRIVNEIIDKGDIFALLYLKNVLEGGQILVDKKPEIRAAFLERYGFKFRECEGLIQEVLA